MHSDEALGAAGRAWGDGNSINNLCHNRGKDRANTTQKKQRERKGRGKPGAVHSLSRGILNKCDQRARKLIFAHRQRNGR